MSRLPMRFEANAGQWDRRLRFVGRGNGTTLFITDDGMTLTLRDVKMPPRKPGARREDEDKARDEALAGAKTAAVTMKLVGVRPSAPRGEDELVTRSNFFLGNVPSKWRTNVPNYGQVRAKAWLPGVDVVWHGGPSGLEYDLAVSAGTDASKIAFDIAGAEALRVKDDGTLEIQTSAGPLLEKPPRVVQAGKELRTRYRLEGARRVGFAIEGYDRAAPVLIDPLLYSTYLGGSSDEYVAFGGLAVDANGSAYVTGYTFSTDFPTASAYQGSNAGYFDVFVTKLSPSGNSLVYSTYLGGSGGDSAEAIAIDANGSAYLAGNTTSLDFPTAGAYQDSNAGNGDAFVTKLSASGSSLVYSTYLGGADIDVGYDIAVDASGSAYVTGYTGSTNYPTASAYQGLSGGYEDAFVTKLSASGSGLVYSTYVGGSNYDYAYGIAVDATGSAYVTGYTDSTNFPTASAYQGSNAGYSDAFVTKLSVSGSSLVYSTYLGGSSAEAGFGIAVDASGSVYVSGGTTSTDFPAASAYQGSNAGKADAFVTKLSASGSSLAYSTYLGGSGGDRAQGIVVNASGNAYVTGFTTSTDFPTASATQDSNEGSYDAFVSKLGASGSSLVYSTYLGGSGYDDGYGIAVDSGGSGYVAGYTDSTDFPTANAYLGPSGKKDAFVAKLDAELVLSPPSATVPPKGSVSFTATGGSGTGYVWTVPTNNSGGSIDGPTGLYTAGATPNVTDTVQVADSFASIATADVTVTAGVAITPPSTSVAPGGKVTFSASGGSGTGYVWSVSSNASGATIDASTGAYTAGATSGVTDTVQVTDSLGNTATATVQLPAVTPPDAGASPDLDGGSGADAGNPDVGNSGGCGCDVVGDTPGEASLAWAALGALAFIVRRRRRTLRHPRRAGGVARGG